MNNGCVIQTGDWVGAKWKGPQWTPFAQAIADHYSNQVPWFYNTRTDFTVVPQRRTVLTKPQQHDVLIFGAYAQGNGAQLPFVYLQVTHQESGVPWVVPNLMPGVPLTAFAGLNGNRTTNLFFPEAFFLPAYTQLKLDWTMLGIPSIVNPDPFVLTLIGVQLTGGARPERVTMPNGQKIKLDSRLPLFMSTGFGSRISGGTFLLGTAQQRHQFLPPIDCDCEIHDLCSNNISEAFSITPSASSLQVKLTVLGVQNQWTPNYSPLTAVFGGPGGGGGGGEGQTFPALPYTKPYLLPKGHRIKIAVQNTSDTQTYTQSLVTFRGVRLCEY